MVTCCYFIHRVIIKYLGLGETLKLYFAFELVCFSCPLDSSLKWINFTKIGKRYERTWNCVYDKARTGRWINVSFTSSRSKIESFIYSHLTHHRSAHATTHCHRRLCFAASFRTFNRFVNWQNHACCFTCRRQCVYFDDWWFPDAGFEIISDRFFVDINAEPTIACKRRTNFIFLMIERALKNSFL